MPLVVNIHLRIKSIQTHTSSIIIEVDAANRARCSSQHIARTTVIFWNRGSTLKIQGCIEERHY
jgi:hypothetical protein